MRQSVMVSAAALGLMVLAGRSVGSAPLAPAGPETSVAPAGPEVLIAATPPVSVATTNASTSQVSGVVTIRTADGGSFEVDSSIAANVQRLIDDAADDGVVLGGWGLRSHQRQHELRRENRCPDDGSWTHSDDEDPSVWASPSSCRTPTARPGLSNHETGKAIDFTVDGSVIPSHQSPAFQWLAANAARYGLKNLPSEPWHWSVDGG